MTNLAPVPLEQALDKTADEIYEATQTFYRSSLTTLVACKVFIGRKLAQAEYGDGAVSYISEKTGISKTVLHDSQKMYREEGLTPAKEKKFIKEFSTSYSSWREYRERLHGNVPQEEKVETKCKHCPLHCNNQHG